MSTLTYEAGMDFDKLGALTIGFDEDGGGVQNVTISTGRYFHLANASSAAGPHPHMVSDYTDLATALEDAWDAVTAASSVSVTFDRTTGHYTFAATGLTTLELTLNTLAQNVVGMAASRTGALSYESTVIPYYWIDTALGCRTGDSQIYESDADLAFDNEAHDGSTEGVAKDGAAEFRDWVQAAEPYTSVWRKYVTASIPWTWQDFYRHCRNVEPFACYDGSEVQFYRLRAVGATFKPRLQTKDYYAIADLPIRAQYLGAV